MTSLTLRNNIRMPLSDKTNVLNMKSDKNSENVTRNTGNKVKLSKVNNIKRQPNRNIKKSNETNAAGSVENVKTAVEPCVIPLKQHRVAKKDLKPSHKDAVNTGVFNTKPLKVILVDDLKGYNNLQNAHERISRRTRGRAVQENQALSLDKTKSLVKEYLSTNKKNLKNTQGSQVHKDLRYNEAIIPSSSTNKVHKTLKVVLTNICLDNNIVHRRSKSFSKGTHSEVQSARNLRRTRSKSVCTSIPFQEKNNIESQAISFDKTKSLVKEDLSTSKKKLNTQGSQVHKDLRYNEAIIPSSSTNKVHKTLKVVLTNICLDNNIVHRRSKSFSKGTHLEVQSARNLRRTRSKSICTSIPIQEKNNIESQALSFDKTKSLVKEDLSTSKKKLKNTQGSQVHKDLRYNEAIIPSSSTNKVHKTLKVVLTNICLDNNIVHRRSKSFSKGTHSEVQFAQNLRRTRSKSICTSIPFQEKNNIESQALSFDKTKSLVKDSKVKLKNTQPLQVYNNLRKNEAIIPSSRTNKLHNTLKVVLTDICSDNNSIVHRRSKSCCEEVFHNKEGKFNEIGTRKPRSHSSHTIGEIKSICDVLNEATKTTEENNVNITKKITRMKAKDKAVNFSKATSKNRNLMVAESHRPSETLKSLNIDDNLNFVARSRLNTNVKKNDAVPIYKKLFPEQLKPQSEDLYEFTDFSPKAKKVKRQHKSSFFFDKDTHELIKKLEAKEAKAKRKVIRKKKKLEKPKSYGKIVEGIMSNVMQKIVNNKGPVNSKQTAHPITRNVVQQNLKKDIPKNIIHINNFHEEMNIMIHSRPEAPSNIKRAVPELSIKPHEAAASTTVTTRKPLANSDTQPKNHVNFLHESPRSIGSCDNSISQSDIECCFGFEDVPVPHFASSPAPHPNENTINILSNVVLRPLNESPIDFNIRRVNANSTMVKPNSSPWRLSLVNVRNNPHFVSIKSNALPRIDQEVVLEHTLVEGYENACSKTPRKREETPVKKHAVQQSILDFVDSNIEKEIQVLQCSLFDSEAFNSPEKKTKMVSRNRVQEVKRNLLENEHNIVSSTPIRRKPLTDISNSLEESSGQEPQNVTYFGFDESTQIHRRRTPEKRNKNAPKENEENAKPSRFDVNKLKSYAKKEKIGRKRVRINDEVVAFEDQNKTVSLVEASNEENVGEVHLFEEPEEMLDNMSPVHIDEKRPRRKRADSSDSDSSDCEKKRRKRKKTKLEVEQEAWIKSFNKMCEETDRHELELV